jgi:hypothetical protein
MMKCAVFKILSNMDEIQAEYHLKSNSKLPFHQPAWSELEMFVYLWFNVVHEPDRHTGLQDRHS